MSETGWCASPSRRPQVEFNVNDSESDRSTGDGDDTYHLESLQARRTVLSACARRANHELH